MRLENPECQHYHFQEPLNSLNENPYEHVPRTLNYITTVSQQYPELAAFTE